MTAGKSRITTHLSSSQFKAARPEEEVECLMALLPWLAATMPKMTDDTFLGRSHLLQGPHPEQRLLSIRAAGSGKGFTGWMFAPSQLLKQVLLVGGWCGAWCVSGIYNYTFIELVQSELQLQAKSSLLEGFNKEFPPENGELHHLPSVSGGFPASCWVTPILTTLVDGYCTCLAVSLCSIGLICLCAPHIRKTSKAFIKPFLPWASGPWKNWSQSIRTKMGFQAAASQRLNILHV